MSEISFKNSERLLRKWQKTLGNTFFAAHCISLRITAAPLIYFNSWCWDARDGGRGGRQRKTPVAGPTGRLPVVVCPPPSQLGLETVSRRIFSVLVLVLRTDVLVLR